MEDAFERRLSELASSEATAPSNDDPSAPQIAGPQVIATTESTDAGQAKGIDKSILTVAAPRRYRNREHLRYVAQQACLVCGRKPSDPHHLALHCSPVRSAARSAMSSRSRSVACITGRCIALGDERAWWQAGRHRPDQGCPQALEETRVNEGRCRPMQITQSAIVRFGL